MTKCKTCNKPFDNKPIKAYGKKITPVNCPECRKLNREYQQQLKHIQDIPDKPCEHGANHLNPGGYCNICGAGRDYS